MKIFIYYLEDLDLNTGTPLRAKNTIKFLSKDEQVVVAAPNLSSPELLSKIEFRPLKKYSYPKGLNFFYKIRELERIIKEAKPDILYGIDCNTMFALGVIARRLKIPVVIEMHGAGHSGLDPNVFWRYTLGFVEKILLKRIDGIVTVSSSIKDYYLNLAKNSRLASRVIYGGVDIGLFNPQATLAPEMQAVRQKGKIVVGYVGNFKAYQGIDFILESALDSGDDFVYTMVGKDSERLKKKIAEYRLQDRVFMFGRKSYEEIPGYLKGMDIMVIPRAKSPVTEYAIPSKLAEYMAMGKVVVTTDVGGSGEIIKDKENGILIPTENIPQNLAKSFVLLKTNPELRKKIEENALAFVRNNLTWDKLIGQLTDFLREIYDQRHRK